MALKGKEIASKASKGKTVMKGKEVAGKGKASTSKRKSISRPDDSENGRKKKRSNVLKFFDDEAFDAEIDDEEDSDSEDDVDPDFVDDVEAEVKDANKSGKMHNLPRVLKEEELSDDELEKLLKQRYGRGSEYIVYADESQDTKGYDGKGHFMNSAKDPTIWRVKCMVGREQQIAFCLMQKFVDVQSLGTKLQIISAFTLDHMKGFIYIEADRECDVTEACKGLCSIYSSRLALVPKNEVPHLLSARNKLSEVSKGSWVRIKCGKYKGDLAQVVAVDDARKKATIKLIPRIDLQAMALKFGGGGATLKQAAVPAPRLISSHELEDFRSHIQYRRDRQTGETFEIIDGLMLKNGYLYKRVSIASLSYWEIKPSAAEIQKFMFAEDTSEDSEWLSALYGGQRKTRSGAADDVMFGASENTSEDKQGSSYELYDLVLFGRKEFGVIIGVESDSFQILRGDSERQDTVTVELHEIKKEISDKNFTSRDSLNNIISINDSVKVIKGPYKARQGIVKHMYKGIIFIFDYKKLENSGFFCAKPELCEKIKYSKDACDETTDDGMVPPGFEDSKDKESPTVSPKRLYQRSDRDQAFNSHSHGNSDQTFSIGQTLRIRVGPLKGHLCRVVAVYRSDVTVKLDSQSKVLKVNCELLSEAGVKGYGNVIRDSSHDLSGSAFAVKPSDADPFGAFPNYNGHDTGKDDAANPWGCNTTWVSGNQTDHSNKGADSWEKAIPSTGGQNASWTKAIDGDKIHDAKNDLPGSWEQNAHSWDKATVKTGFGCSSSDGWQKPNVQNGDQTDSWKVAGDWGKDKLGNVSQADHLANETGGWEKKSGSTGQADPWKIPERSWDKGKLVTVDQKDDWKSENINSWGTGANNQDKGKRTSDDHPSTWDKGKGICDDHPSSWDKGKGSFENETNSLGKAVELQGKGSINKENQDKPWGKASGGWKEQTDSWNNTTASGGNQIGGSDKAAERWDRPQVSCGDQADEWSKAEGESGGQSKSWDMSKYTNEGNTGGWNKVGLAGQGPTDGWNKPKPFGGDKASSWNKGGQSENWDKSEDVSGGKAGGWNKARFAGQGQTNDWNKPKPFAGDQASNWNKGMAVNDGAGGRENDQAKNWNRPKDVDGGWKSDWNRGTTGNTEAGENRDHEDQLKSFGGSRGAGWRGGRGGNRGAGGRGRGGRTFGRGQSSDWNRDQGNHGDKDGAFSGNMSSGWNGGRAGGWNKDRVSDEDHGSSWNKGWSASKEAGGSRGGPSSDWNKDTLEGCGVGKGIAGNQSGSNNDNAGNWNTPKNFGGSQSSGWNRGAAANDEAGCKNVAREASGDKDHWNSEHAFGGDKASGWNKGTNIDGGNRERSDNWNQAKSFGGDQSSGWNKRKFENKDPADDWNRHDQSSSWNKGSGTDKEADGGGDPAGSWSRPKSFGQGQSSGWNEGVGTDKGNDGKEDLSNSWNKPKSFGRGQSSGWNRSDGDGDQSGPWNRKKSFGDGQSSGWNKGVGTDNEGDGSRDQGGSWNRPKAFGPGRSFGRGQSSGRNGDSFGRGRGRRDQAGSWNKGKDSGGDGPFGRRNGMDANEGVGGTGQVGSWKQGEAASKGQWSSWNKETVSNKETWGSGNQAGSELKKQLASVSEAGGVGDRADNWNRTNAFSGGQSSGWNKEELAGSGNGGEPVGGDRSSDWTKVTAANKDAGGSGQQAENWNAGKSSIEAGGIGDDGWKQAKGSGWNTGVAPTKEASGTQGGGWNGAKPSDGAGGSNWNSVTIPIKDTCGSGSQADGWNRGGKTAANDDQTSGFSQRTVPDEAGGSGSQAGGWEKTAGSWGKGSREGGDGRGWN